jgi:hypothetical protein
LKTVPKKFRCVNCDKETYCDSPKCACGAEMSCEPINREHYKCYLNGKFYGSGSLEYMRELFVDYFITCKMYGRPEADFKIVKEDELSV